MMHLTTTQLCTEDFTKMTNIMEVRKNTYHTNNIVYTYQKGEIELELIIKYVL